MTQVYLNLSSRDAFLVSEGLSLLAQQYQDQSRLDLVSGGSTPYLSEDISRIHNIIHRLGGYLPKQRGSS